MCFQSFQTHSGCLWWLRSAETLSLSSVCVGNSVQRESLAFITAEPPETFTEEQNKTKQTLKLLWLIQFKFGSATRKCSKKKTKKTKTNESRIQRRWLKSRFALCRGGDEAGWKAVVGIKNNNMFCLWWQSCPDEGQRAQRCHVACFQCSQWPFNKVLFNVRARKDTHTGSGLCSAFLGHSKCFTCWSHYSLAQCSQWCVSECAHDVWHDSRGLLCLPQNSNSENPNCTAIEGVLEAYFQSLRTVQLYGPTNFAPVINQVARWDTRHMARRQSPAAAGNQANHSRDERVCFICTFHPLIIGSQMCVSSMLKSCMFVFTHFHFKVLLIQLQILSVAQYLELKLDNYNSPARHHRCSLLRQGQIQRTHLKLVDLWPLTIAFSRN